MKTIDWPASAPKRRPARLIALAALFVTLLGGGTALSYYVESLWFASLGFSAVFWTTLNAQVLVFAVFAGATFLVLHGSFLALKPKRLSDLTGQILIDGRPLQLPVEPVLRLIALVVSLLIAALSGLGMMASWMTFGLYWHSGLENAAVDPIFGRSIPFYLFTLPVWQLLAGWFTTLAVIIFVVATFFTVVGGGSQLLTPQSGRAVPSLRGVSLAFAGVLLAFAAQTYLGRFERLLADHTIFSGVTYTDAHVAIPGMLIVSIALVFGALVAAANAVVKPRLPWLVASIVPAVVSWIGVSLVGWYVGSFIVRPNELVRERPFITNNIEMTRRAFALDTIKQVPFANDPGIDALEPAANQATLENIRLWDWRALQDTLRQIQAIRTYYDFADIDIDRYEIDGTTQQMMLAARELNVERLPESSRNWINEKLIYTHGYGITMNTVNGFTPDGLPNLVLANMPVQTEEPSLKLTRPEIYFGELTNGDVYVKTRQEEFDFPQGDTNSVNSYEGTGGIQIGGFFRRLLIALDQGDLTRMPFSDDVTSESRLLMRRNIRARATRLAPFLTFDADPYIVVTADGRLIWMMDAYTTSGMYPYARHYGLGNRSVNYLRNSIKATIDAYDGSVAFYVFDTEDPIINGYRSIFPTLFRDAGDMPADLRTHVRYPELLLEVQAAVYGLYHMTAPDVFYNREDLWTVANAVGQSDLRQQLAQTMEPNSVLMKLPGEGGIEFVQILPFTPANRNNLIGWIAGRGDGPNYGSAIVYDFPRTKLVDGPLQVEARIDQDAQLSGQLSLWNQQGSRVIRGSLIVIPVGRALLYAEPIYLQSERSPMPQLRIVVLAIQDKLAYGPTFEAALASLFGNAPSSLSAQATSPGQTPLPARPDATAAPPSSATDVDALIVEAARDLADYQRLTAEGRLGEAGQRLEGLKLKLERLQSRPR